jgi:hypothetical protein
MILPLVGEIIVEPSQTRHQNAPASPSLNQATMHESPYADSRDRFRHMHNMQRLVEETGCPLHDLVTLYEETLATFNSRARIQDYVLILVSKNVKNVLKRH